MIIFKEENVNENSRDCSKKFTPIYHLKKLSLVEI